MDGRQWAGAEWRLPAVRLPAGRDRLYSSVWKRILLLSASLPPRVVSEAAPAFRIRPVAGRSGLAAAIVDDPAPACILIQEEPPADDLPAFLETLVRVFPRLPVGLIVMESDPPPAVPEGVVAIDGAHLGPELEAALARFLSPLTHREMRARPRCAWPLAGALSFDRQSWQEYPVRSISATGAFLESPAAPPAGSRGVLQIAFRDLRLLVGCETLGPRQASSGLPTGFGVRFTDPTSPAVHIIEAIVRDALLRALLQPGEEPTAPSLGGRDLLLPAEGEAGVDR